MSEMPNHEKEYTEALARIAKSIGLSPEELEKRVKERSAGLHPTTNCITLAELENYDLFSMPSNRRNHILTCDFCEVILRIHFWE